MAKLTLVHSASPIASHRRMFPALAVLLPFISSVTQGAQQAELCRDGSVFSSVALHELKSPERLYQKLGCKLAVGMPFKDIASSDTLFMRELPAKSDSAARTALRRLQEVGMHVIVPAAHLRGNPMAGAIPLMLLSEAASTALPEGTNRCDLLVLSWVAQDRRASASVPLVRRQA